MTTKQRGIRLDKLSGTPNEDCVSDKTMSTVFYNVNQVNHVCATNDETDSSRDRLTDKNTLQKGT